MFLLNSLEVFLSLFVDCSKFVFIIFVDSVLHLLNIFWSQSRIWSWFWLHDRNRSWVQSWDIFWLHDILNYWLILNWRQELILVRRSNSLWRLSFWLPHLVSWWVCWSDWVFRNVWSRSVSDSSFLRVPVSSFTILLNWFQIWLWVWHRILDCHRLKLILNISIVLEHFILPLFIARNLYVFSLSITHRLIAWLL